MMFLWAIRIFLFTLYESPKYLMGRGRDEEAVEVVHKVAEANGKKSSLTVERLMSVGALESPRETKKDLAMDSSAIAVIRRHLSKFSSGHVKALFATRKLAYSTSLLILLWGERHHPPSFRRNLSDSSHIYL